MYFFQVSSLDWKDFWVPKKQLQVSGQQNNQHTISIAGEKIMMKYTLIHGPNSVVPVDAGFILMRESSDVFAKLTYSVL